MNQQHYSIKKKVARLSLACIASLFFVNKAEASIYTVTTNSDAGVGSFRQAVLDANNHVGLDTLYFSSITDGNTIAMTSGVIIISDDLYIKGNGVSSTFISHQATGFEGIKSSAGVRLKIDHCSFIAEIINNGLVKYDVSNTPNSSLEINHCSFEGNNLNAVAISGVSWFGPYVESTLRINACSFRNFSNASVDLATLDTAYISNSTFDNCSIAVLTSGDNTHISIINNTSIQSNIRAFDLNRYITCTLKNNTITNNASGLALTGGSVIPEITIENNIIYGNTIDVDLSYLMGDSVSIIQSNNIVGSCLPGTIYNLVCPVWFSSADPLLDPSGLQNNGGATSTIAITSGSLAINNATINAPTLDQRGYSRPDAADIGAYEFNGIPPCSITNPGNFTTQPSSLSICEYESILFSYDFTGQSDSIQWNLSFDAQNWFVDDPNVGSILQVDSVEALVNGIYVMAIAYGCGVAIDSTTIVQLSVDTLSIETTLTGITITAIQPNAQYQWLDCSNGYAVINGAVAQNFTPTINGNYAVAITNGSCMDTSACVTINTLNLGNNNELGSMYVYPNPATNQFTLVGKMLHDGKLIMRDLNGKIVFEKEGLSGTTHSINCNQEAGMYFLEITHEDEIQLIKLIIE